jgi:hypothetical protein
VRCCCNGRCVARWVGPSNAAAGVGNSERQQMLGDLLVSIETAGTLMTCTQQPCLHHACLLSCTCAAPSPLSCRSCAGLS